jgi:hypothetical protein
MYVAAIATGLIGIAFVSGPSLANFGHDATRTPANPPRIDPPGPPRLLEPGLDKLTRTTVAERACGFWKTTASENNTAICQGGIRATSGDGQPIRPAKSQLITREDHPCL